MLLKTDFVIKCFLSGRRAKESNEGLSAAFPELHLQVRGRSQFITVKHSVTASLQRASVPSHLHVALSSLSEHSLRALFCNNV